MAETRKAHSAISEYALAVRGIKRPFARLCLVAQEMPRNKCDVPMQAIDLRMLRQLPFNDEFGRLFSDILTQRMLLSDLAPRFTRFLGLKLTVCGDSRYWLLPTASLSLGGPEPIDILAAIREAGSVLVRPCSTATLDCGHTISCFGGMFAVDGASTDEKAVSEYLDRMPDDTAVIAWSQQCFGQPFSALVLKVCGYEDSSANVQVCSLGVFEAASCRGVELHGGSLRSDIEVPADVHSEAETVIKQILSLYPELGYVCGWFALSGQHAVLLHVDTGLDIALSNDYPPELLSLLEDRFGRKRSATIRQSARSFARELSEVHAERKGFMGFMYRKWIRGIIDDYKTANTTLQEKLWAHRRGFYSYRITQYGLTVDNVQAFLSDYDYKRIRPLNGAYCKWLWDKVSTFLVMHPFSSYMPAHYCRIIGKRSARVVPFGKSGIDSMPAIIALLEYSGILAVKRSIGSHGEGFHKLEYRGKADEYYIDDRPCDSVQLAGFLLNLDGEFMVTEYVRMHPFMAMFYGNVVSTVRIMAIRTGLAFELCDAYVRIGTSSTGNTDNLAVGGVVARVDLASGEITEPERIVRHVFSSCETHPDTGVAIEGTIPFWDEIKEIVAQMCQYLFPLEYLGFDVVVTEDGFKVLEINTHQDLHKYARYPESVKAYLLQKRDERA